MPGMNGLDVLKFLRRVDSRLDLPIIMVTAKGESEDVVEALELGANDYVTKPLDFPVVLARIRTQLALNAAVRQVTELEQMLDGRNRELEAAAAKLAAVHEDLTRDLEAAARVQQALLPALPEVPGARLARAFRPCDRLAGDALTAFPLDERHLGLGVLDASGQGAAAALLAVTACHLLARAAGGGPAVVPPAEVAARLSAQLPAEATAGQTFTLLYGVLALDSGSFRYVAAGHPGPVHLPRGGPAAPLEAPGLPVGVGAGEYREHQVTLQPGDRLLLYSDGVTGVRNADGEHFGLRRLLAALDQARQAPVADSLAALLQTVEGWRGDTPRPDDLSLLLVERTAR
jgi:sigma-B regulation protein RsbU (phosphoserine phosphatase)